MLQLILIGLLYVIGIWALLFLLYKISPYLDNLIMKSTHISKIVQSIILLICTLKLPFYWYVILKIPITYIFINFAFYDENRKILVEEEKTSFWFNLWVCLAILYNPIYQMPLGKTVWIVVDVITILILFWSMTIQNSKNISKTKEKEGFNFKEALFKFYLEQDFFTFHYLGKLDMINPIFVFNYEDLFNPEIEGITTFFSVQQPDKISYKDYFGRDYSRLKNNSHFAIFIFGYESTFSTNSVSGIQSLSFNKIEVYRKTNDNNVSLVDICNVGNIRNKTV